MGAIKLARWHKRVLSGFVLAFIVIAIVWKGGPMFAAWVFVAALICLYEWIKLSLKSKNKIIFSFVGFVYISICFWTCYLIREHHSVKIALLFLTMIWASDISAYIFGKTLGGPKMSPKISPNKTWAGFLGATVLPGIAGGIYLLSYNFVYDIAYSKFDLFERTVTFMAVGALIGLVGQAGDLLISALKRTVQVKDSGDLIPGHGGLLDRVDAMMLAAPVFLWIVTKYSDVFPG